MWRVPALLGRLADRVQSGGLPTVGWGTVIVIVGWGGALVLAGLIFTLGLLLGVVTLGDLALTVLGAGFSGLVLALTLFWLLSTYGSKLVVAYLVGKRLLQRFAPQWVERPLWPLLLGVLLYTLVRSIPLLGWVVGVLVTLVGLGTMWMWFRDEPEGRCRI